MWVFLWCISSFGMCVCTGRLSSHPCTLLAVHMCKYVGMHACALTGVRRDRCQCCYMCACVCRLANTCECLCLFVCLHMWLRSELYGFRSFTQEVFQSDSHVSHITVLASLNLTKLLNRGDICQSASTSVAEVSVNIAAPWRRRKALQAQNWPSAAVGQEDEMTAWPLWVLVLCLSDRGVTGCSGKKTLFFFGGWNCLKLFHFRPLWSEGWNCSFRDF